MEAPAELGVAAVLVGAAGVITRVQLVAAFGHGGDLCATTKVTWPSVKRHVCKTSNVEFLKTEGLNRSKVGNK